MFDKESLQDQLPESLSNLRVQTDQEREEHKNFIQISKFCVCWTWKILLRKWWCFAFTTLTIKVINKKYNNNYYKNECKQSTQTTVMKHDVYIYRDLDKAKLRIFVFKNIYQTLYFAI